MSEVIQNQEIMKLYEYELYKPELCEGFLEHHGILGMHWGKRNGPPYPLGSDKSTGKRLKESFSEFRKKRKKKAAIKKAKKTRALKKKEELRNKKQEEQNKKKEYKLLDNRSKEDVIKANDIKTMLKNVGTFSNDEINKVLTRLDTEKRLRDRVEAIEKANMPLRKKIASAVKTNLKEGIAEGGKQALRTVGRNAMKKGLKEGLKYIASDDEDAVFNKKLIDELFKEGKKNRR